MKKLLLFTLAALAVSVTTIGFRPAEYQAGDEARDFSLKNVDGRMISLSSCNMAKGFIVAFTCNHCPFAKMYESRIQDLDKQFASKGFPVIAISSNDPGSVPEDSWENMVALAKDHHYSFPYLFDASQAVAKAYGATNTPHIFVLNKENGKLIVKYVGSIDDNPQDAAAAKKHYVADAVNALLAGKDVAVTKTKAIGCGIKWKNG